MATYVMLTTLTDEGRKTIKTHPQRIREVNKEVEAMGVKIKDQYAVLGRMTSSIFWRRRIIFQ